MGLESVEAEISELRGRAADHQRSYSRAIKSIDADTSLSESGKASAKAAEYTATKGAMSKLRASEEAILDRAITDRKTRIETPGSGYGTDVISARDAEDRADRIGKADEANSILQRALRRGDMVLAHAIFDKALAHRWATVVDTFTQAKPELRTVVQDLKQLNDAKEASFERTMHYAAFRP